MAGIQERNFGLCTCETTNVFFYEGTKQIKIMKIKFDDIMEAFFFVNAGGLANHIAVLDNSTGKVCWHSEDSEINEIPEGLLDSEDAIEIPRKNELCLGTELVFEFAGAKIPDDYEKIQDIFNNRGAYSRFKDFLESKEILEEWYKFKDESQKKARREWCKENEIELID